MCYLRISLFLACPNSQGLQNFMWKLDGYWILGSTVQGKRETVSKCAEDCNAKDKCVAFSYIYSGKKKQECYHYHNRAYLNKTNVEANDYTKTHTKAYIKCQGN